MREFRLKSASVSPLAVDIDHGKLPTNSLSEISRNFRSCRLPSESGMAPLNLLPERSRASRAPIAAIHAGNSPVKELRPKSRKAHAESL